MSAETSPRATPDTRQKLLDAAAEVFAEFGYHQATVREITQRAGVSLALVNYHFRDKAELYAALLRRVAEESRAVTPGDEILTGPPESQLRRFVEQFLHRALSPDTPAWRRIIFAREIAQPSAAFDTILDMTRPLFARVDRIVTALSPRRLSPEQVALHTASLLGQCLYYIEHRPIIKAIQPELADYQRVQTICDHIIACTLAALQNPPSASSSCSKSSKPTSDSA